MLRKTKNSINIRVEECCIDFEPKSAELNFFKLCIHHCGILKNLSATNTEYIFISITGILSTYTTLFPHNRKDFPFYENQKKNPVHILVSSPHFTFTLDRVTNPDFTPPL